MLKNLKKMRCFVLFILIFGSINSYSQFDFNSSIDNIDDWITISNLDAKTDIITNLRNKYSDNCAFKFYDINEFYVIDFENNGLNDILYSGYCGIDGSVTQIFRFNGFDYDIILSVIGKIYAVNKKHEGNPFTIVINNYACCGDFTNVFERYTYFLTENKIKFSVQARFDYVSELVFPKEYFKNPIAFRTINNEYKLRFEPLIDDTTEITRPFDAFGNTIYTYSTNSVGYAIAEKQDNTGRTWWFVKMDNSSDPKMEFTKRFGDNNEQITYSLGWMSSRYLEIIE